MPIYEYLCHRCNRIYSVFMPTMFDERPPQCPRCGAADLERQLSLFAFVRGGKDPLAAIPKPPDEAAGAAAETVESPESLASTAESPASLDSTAAPPERDPKLYRWDELIRDGDLPDRVIIRRKHRPTTD